MNAWDRSLETLERDVEDLIWNGEVTQAEALCGEKIELEEGKARPDATYLAGLHFLRRRVRDFRGSSGEALADLRRGIELDKGAMARLRRGVVSAHAQIERLESLKEQGKLEAAERVCRMLIDTSRDVEHRSSLQSFLGRLGPDLQASRSATPEAPATPVIPSTMACVVSFLCALGLALDLAPGFDASVGEHAQSARALIYLLGTLGFSLLIRRALALRAVLATND